MTLKITTTKITSDVTAHLAVVVAGGKWVVSWMPGRKLRTLSQAITAMSIAELAVTHCDPVFAIEREHPEELGMTAKSAFRLAGQTTLFGEVS